MQQKNLHIFRSSAGSGKTYSLVRYFIRLALMANSKTFNTRYFRHILAITFTNKAASEMKERVLAFVADLSQGVGKGDGNSFFTHIQQDTGLSEDEIMARSSSLLTAILHNYTDLSISTIDKFVFKIVRTFAHDLQISQGFEVEMDQDNLIQPVVTFLISRIGSNPELSDALVAFALSNADEGKSYNLENALEQFSSHLFLEKSEKYLDSLRSVSVSDYMQIKNQLVSELNAFENVLLEKRNKFLVFCKTFDLDSSHFIRRYFYNYFDNFKKRSADKFHPSKSVLKNVEEGIWYAKSIDQDKKDIIDEHADYLSTLFEEVQTHLKANFSSYIFNKLLFKNIFSVAVLNELSKELELFKQDNNIKHISEFNSAIAEIIRREPTPFIYERLGERYHHFLIDEFQDTSVMQWHNLLPLVHNSLSEGYQNLIVGDAKQSIYRWRGGEVEQFVQLPNTIYQGEKLPNTSEIQKSILSNGQEQHLSDNWRSHKEIVKFNNHFFSTVKSAMKDNLQAIYDACEQNPQGKDGGYVLIDAIEKSPDFKEDVMLRLISQIELLMQKGYEYKDMAILCRTKLETQVAANALTKVNIDVLSDEALLVNASKEVHMLLSILSLLHNANDNVSKTHIATYLFHRELIDCDIHQLLHSLGKDNDVLFFNFLIKAGVDFKPYQLWKLPIYDLVERLIDLFNLPTDDIYIQYFLDVVHTFSIKNSNSITAFLDWWDKNNHKEGIIVPEDMNAVKVMTVHKSKGLEFPIVFIPFNWEMGKPASQLWVDAKENIKNMKVALLNNHKILANSDYADLHKEEKNKAIMDDLNVLYVAMTRPKQQLYIFTEKYKDLKELNSLSKFMGYFLEQSGAGFPYEIGQIGVNKKKSKQSKNSLTINYTSTPNWRDVIHLKNNANNLWDVELDKQQWGQLLHECLSKINYIEDKEEVLNQMERNGLLSHSMKSRLRTRVEELLADSDIKPFFETDWQIKTEHEILQSSGEIYIPDRLLINDKRVKIIDYKTGSNFKMEAHKRQIDNYANLLNRMGFTDVEKVLVYTEQTEKLVRW